ncbi:MAG: PspC domain-containing protein [Firmicutes bacterium]|nr:PspC domain-containing protein [Bacillota bacterium]
MSQRKLYLSDNRIIAGVAGGIAEYLDIDPTIVRIIWAFAVFSGGIGALAYIIGVMVIPPRPVSEPRVTIEGAERPPRQTLGIILILVGLVFLLNNFIPSIPWRLVWPIALIILGLFYIYNERRN